MLGRGARGSLPGGGGGGSRGGYGRGRGRGGRFGGRGNPLHTGAGGRGGSGGGQWTGRKSKDELDAEESALEASLGFEAYTEGPARLGWLMNMSSARATPPSHLCTLAFLHGPGLLGSSGSGPGIRSCSRSVRGGRAHSTTGRAGRRAPASTCTSCARRACFRLSGGGAQRAQLCVAAPPGRVAEAARAAGREHI